MINLIPPKAKKSIQIEYWLRVLSVWFMVWSAALLLGIFILIPAYVLIHLQVKVYSSSVKEASEKIVDYESVSKELQHASQQASKLLAGSEEPLMSEYVTSFKELESANISISSITLQRSDKGIVGPAHIGGEAIDRKALAAFRDRLLAQPGITAVDLPLSNLTKDKDIQFSLTVTFDNPKKP